jgi:hypothetical protein
MGIAGVEPHQLAPTMGMTGSESTGSPAPSSSSTAPDRRVLGGSGSLPHSRPDLIYIGRDRLHHQPHGGGYSPGGIPLLL